MKRMIGRVGSEMFIESSTEKRNVGRSVWREAGEERKKSVLVVRLFVIIELQCGNFHQFGFQLLILHGNELFQLFAGFIRRGHDLHHVAVHAVCAGRVLVDGVGQNGVLVAV